jgi:hypothetical protein
VLILGVVGLAMCQLTGPFAWKLGNDVLRESTAAGWPEPNGNKAGRICGMVATALLVLTVLAGIISISGLALLA